MRFRVLLPVVLALALALGLCTSCNRGGLCVETLNVGIHNETSGTLCGKLTNGHGTQVGFSFWQTDIYLQEQNPTVYTCADTVSGTNNFYYDVGNLRPGTSYSYKAWAKESGTNRVFGDAVSFTTEGQGTAAELATLGADNLTSSSVTLHCQVVTLGTATDVQMWIDVGTTSGSLNVRYPIEGAVQAPGEFSVDVAGLDPDTTYYYQADGSCISGTLVPGEEKSFKTPS